MMPEEYTDMTFDEYQAEADLNFSKAKKALTCPISFLSPDTGTTDAMRQGTICHTALLEPGLMRRNFVRGPEGVRRGTKAWKEAEDKAGRKALVKPAEHDRALDMAKSVKSNTDAVFMLESDFSAPWTPEEEMYCISDKKTTDSLKEVSYAWKDQKSGLMLKARIDCLSHRWDSYWVVDYKTTDDASPFAMGRKLVTQPYYYLMQMAWYCRAVKTFYESEFPRREAHVNACIIAAEKSPGYPTAVYHIDHDDLEEADKKIDDLLALIVKIKEGEVEQKHYPTLDLAAPEWWRQKEEATV